jgi:hypothetical protein
VLTNVLPNGQVGVSVGGLSAQLLQLNAQVVATTNRLNGATPATIIATNFIDTTEVSVTLI